LLLVDQDGGAVPSYTHKVIGIHLNGNVCGVRRETARPLELTWQRLRSVIVLHDAPHEIECVNLKRRAQVAACHATQRSFLSNAKGFSDTTG
jgi:hypothetical protein